MNEENDEWVSRDYWIPPEDMAQIRLRMEELGRSVGYATDSIPASVLEEVVSDYFMPMCHKNLRREAGDDVEEEQNAHHVFPPSPPDDVSVEINISDDGSFDEVLKGHPLNDDSGDDEVEVKFD